MSQLKSLKVVPTDVMSDVQHYKNEYGEYAGQKQVPLISMHSQDFQSGPR